MLAEKFYIKDIKEYEEKEGKSVIDTLKTLDQGYESLDNYIQADERRSYMSAALDLLCEFDMDKHALSSLGVPAQKIKERMDKAIEGIAEKFEDKLNGLADSAIDAAESSDTPSEDTEEEKPQFTVL